VTFMVEGLLLRKHSSPTIYVALRSDVVAFLFFLPLFFCLLQSLWVSEVLFGVLLTFVSATACHCAKSAHGLCSCMHCKLVNKLSLQRFSTGLLQMGHV